MAKDQQNGRHKKRSVLTSFSQLAEVKMNADLVRARNYNPRLANIKKYTRQKIKG